MKFEISIHSLCNTKCAKMEQHPITNTISITVETQAKSFSIASHIFTSQLWGMHKWFELLSSFIAIKYFKEQKKKKPNEPPNVEWKKEIMDGEQECKHTKLLKGTNQKLRFNVSKFTCHQLLLCCCVWLLIWLKSCVCVSVCVNESATISVALRLSIWS